MGVRSQGGEKALVAWVVPREGSALGSGDLRAFLAERLPAALVPGAFVVLDAFPLTPNGKVDRRALPTPEPEERTAAGLAAPRTPAEELLAGAWAALLRIERVGIDQDFFALGGHSLLATRLVSRIRDLFGVELPLRAVFEAPTVAALAARIAAEGKGPEAPPVLPRRPGERLLLSFGQERLWILDRLTPDTAVYNMPLAFRLRGPLAAGALADALSEVVRRHEALRTTFERTGGELVQVVSPPEPRPLPVADLSALPEAAREAEAGASPGRRRSGRSTSGGGRSSAQRSSGSLRRSTGCSSPCTTSSRTAGRWGCCSGRSRTLRGLRGEPAVVARRTAGAVSRFRPLAAALARRRRARRAALLVARAPGGKPPILELPADRPRSATQSQRGGQARLGLPGDLAGRLRELAAPAGRDPLHDPARGVRHAALPLHRPGRPASSDRRSPAAPGPRPRG